MIGWGLNVMPCSDLSYSPLNTANLVTARLPNLRNLPLATLKTFEAAARHQSHSKAAAELSLTDSAVSHQIRRLEEALGCELSSSPAEASF